jgi:adenine-specific DNA glycosylase
VSRELGTVRHTITHHHYTLTVAIAKTRGANRGFRWFAAADMERVPLSTTVKKALRLEAKLSGF